MLSIDLTNKTILVTGASSGIGKSTALLCAKAGAHVILSGRNENALKETQILCGNNAAITPCNLSSEEEIALFAQQLPVLNGFVHCAGILKTRPIKFIGKTQLNEVFDINYTSGILLSSNLLKHKKIADKASLVFISSVSARHPYTGGALYTSAKAALEAFARGLALEVSSKKIRCNVLAPALVKTPMLQEAFSALSAKELQDVEAQYPLGLGEPEDVAHAALFLLSEAARWITGTIIDMDGGLLLNNKK